MDGKAPVRVSDDDGDTPKNTGVPSAGKPKKKKKAAPDSDSKGMEPQPEG